ncbi:spermidine synthase [Dongia sp. agr-C8]
MGAQAPTSRSTWLFAGTMLLSAWLVFLIQPMLGRMILPKLGGAASVWITVSLFFQIALLAGYFYAHVISARLKPPLQMAAHAFLAVAAIFLLPVVVPESWAPPADRPPQGDLILMMALTVGLPFVVVSATAPLLQRWYSLTGAKDAGDPYFLYAASNLGSLAALILYPLLVEPELGLKDQSGFWAATYLVLLAGLIACGWVTLRQYVPPVVLCMPAPDAGRDLNWKRRLHWLALAAAPSSLFLGVTLQISTDIASVPLLWILPLMVYLLTFVIAFARRPLLTREGVARSIPYVATIAVLVSGFETSIGLPQIAIGLALLFFLALSCHSELVALRPAPRQLTEFFLLMSLGGALGGLFNAVLAPLVFSGVYEYPLAVFAAIALWAIGRGIDPKAWLNWKWLAAAVALFLVLRGVMTFASGHGALQGLVVAKAVAAVLCFAARRKPVAMTLLAAAVLAAGSDISLRPELARYRSFFGVHRIELGGSDTVPVHFLMHGNTTHGAQFTDAARQREPLLYYAKAGPAGQAIAAMRAAQPVSPVGVIGLGAGAMACLRQPGEAWTYFEIDPAILATARNPEYFSYLENCTPDARVVLGDGRLKLALEPDDSYRLLVLDAFGSDSIPVHLLTREALDLYISKLQPGGMLLMHLSNRNIELLPAVARLAADRNLVGRFQFFPGASPADSLISPSEWAVLARDESDLGSLATDARWQRFPVLMKGRVWTDDYVDILSVIRWPWR